MRQLISHNSSRIIVVIITLYFVWNWLVPSIEAIRERDHDEFARLGAALIAMTLFFIAAERLARQRDVDVSKLESDRFGQILAEIELLEAKMGLQESISRLSLVGRGRGSLNWAIKAKHDASRTKLYHFKKLRQRLLKSLLLLKERNKENFEKSKQASFNLKLVTTIELAAGIVGTLQWGYGDQFVGFIKTVEG